MRVRKDLYRGDESMNDTFEKCVQFVLDREGRQYENDPNDPGGETHFGISKKAYPDLDIKALTEDEAKAIYFRDYWEPAGCQSGKYPPKMCLAIFDTAVNMGVSVALALIEEIVLLPLDEYTPEMYLFRRLRRYSNLIQRNPKLERYCHNWMLRVVKVSEFKF
jgi:hypothetical protein